MTDAERAALLDVVRVLVAEKDWEGCGGLEMTDEIRVTIAGQGRVAFSGPLNTTTTPNVGSILVYSHRLTTPCPGGRLRSADEKPGEDPNIAVLGHAQMGGPVVLSWRSARAGGRDATDGRNLVFHEFAHKLDMLDGVVDGTPPLLRRQRRAWFAVMTREFEALQKRRRPKVDRFVWGHQCRGVLRSNR